MKMNMKEVSPRKRMDMEGSGPKKMAKGGSCGTKKYAKGGSVTRADGVCTKGHTRGKMV